MEIEELARQLRLSNKRTSGLIEEALDDTVYFIQASSFEREALWEKYTKERPDLKVNLDWDINRTMGHGLTMPDQKTHVTFRFDFIMGKQVCFFDATSALVDWAVVWAFVGVYTAKTDRCLGFCVKPHDFPRCLAALAAAAATK